MVGAVFWLLFAMTLFFRKQNSVHFKTSNNNNKNSSTYIDHLYVMASLDYTASIVKAAFSEYPTATSDIRIEIVKN